MFRGAFLTKVRAESGHTMVCSRRDRKLLVRPTVSDRRQLFTLFRNAHRATVLLTRRLPKQCRLIGNGPTPRNARRRHCVKGVPAKPQYPLRVSDGRGSLVSHRHIMQPDPWHRKKCPLIWWCRRGKNIRYSTFLRRALGPGLERLKANALCSQRSRIMGHHFFITASSSVTSIGNSPF